MRHKTNKRIEITYNTQSKFHSNFTTAKLKNHLNRYKINNDKDLMSVLNKATHLMQCSLSGISICVYKNDALVASY